jgi:threonine dehydratase
MPSLQDIKDAYKRIKKMVNKTPVFTSRTLNKIIGTNVFFKCENFQRGGSFKFRGVTNKLLQLDADEKNKGIITHSSGNHAQAVALASTLLGIKSVIVMPENAPRVKVDATRGYGAKIVRCASSVKAREQTCQHLKDKHGYILVHPYDDDQIIAGAGTTMLEFIKEIGDLDVVFCPIGGGGLVSGVSTVLKGLRPNSTVIGVEPEKADDAFRSIRNGRLYPSVYPDTVADGLRTSLSDRTFNVIQRNVDEIITVSEKEIIDAMKFIWVRMKMVVEPSGAVSLAGVFRMSKNEKFDHNTIGVVVSGGNVDLKEFFDTYYSTIS